MGFKQKKKKRKKIELKRRRKNQIRKSKCLYCHSKLREKPRHITYSKGRPKKSRGSRKKMMAKKNDKMSRGRYYAFLGNYMNFGSYLSSYDNAFRTLVESVNKSGGHVDSLAYPILFTARHAMELGFKSNIRYFAKYSEKTDYTNSDSHILLDLFNGFKLHVSESIKNLKDKYGIEIEENDIKEFEEYSKIVDGLVDKFDVLDRGSFCFRYPVDKKNKRVFQSKDTVNILDVKELFEKTMVLLYYTADVFAKYTDYADYIEKTYEDEMRAAYEY